jgi:Na+-transporting NADH:ubiquinone oxidoreductase subunit NqrC
MNTTSTNRNLLVIIGVLLLTNIAVLVYFLWLKEPEKASANKDKNGMSEMLKKDVGFNDQQLAQYKQLKDSQSNTIRPMFDDMRKVKDSLFRLLGTPNVSDSLLNKAADAIAQKQKALELQTFNHFRKLRGLCTAEQQPKYDSMVVRMFRKMGKQPRRPGTDKEEKK